MFNISRRQALAASGGIIGSLLVPSKYGRRYDCGTHDESPTILHVSRGISGEHPVRYNCLPEVTLITLRRPGNDG